MRTLAALAALALAVVAARGAREAAFAHRRETQRHEPLYHLPRAETLPALSLGYRRAVADLVWMRALVYFGDELAEKSTADHVYAYADAILALDADFPAVYRWVGVAGLYRPVAPTREDVERVIALQRRGLERFPHDGELKWELASNLRFELAPILRRGGDQSALREAEREGALLTLEAVASGDAPEWAARASADSLDGLGERGHLLEQLEKLYVLVDDDATREEIGRRLQELRGRQELEATAVDFERLRALHARERPWLPLEFFALTHDHDDASLPLEDEGDIVAAP